MGEGAGAGEDFVGVAVVDAVGVGVVDGVGVGVDCCHAGGGGGREGDCEEAEEGRPDWLFRSGRKTPR